MNGTGPLGYINENRTLKIDEENADKIRLIFDNFLELKNINQLKTYLEEKQIKTKSGKNFYKGHLYRILSNKTYIGKITHKDKVYDGLHEAIIDKDVFDKVQKVLSANKTVQHSPIDRKNPSLLAGKLFDDKNNYMSPSHSNTRNRKYRYYVSQALIQHKMNEAGSVSKIPAGEIEKFVTQELKDFVSKPTNIQPLLKDSTIQKQKALLNNIADKVDNQFIRTILSKVFIYNEKVEITICKSQLLKVLEAVTYGTDFPEEIKGETKAPIILTKDIKITATAKNGSVLILTDSDMQQPEINPQLIKAIAKSYLWNKQILSGEVKDSIEIQKREGYKKPSYIQNILNLRFLAPDVVEAILNGTQHRDLSVQQLFAVKTLDWNEQRKVLNI